MSKYQLLYNSEKQFVVDAIIFISIITFFFILSLICALIFGSCYRKGYKAFKLAKNDKYTSDDDYYCETSGGIINTVGIVISCIILLIMFGVFVGNLEMITQIINPEYYTIKEIMSLVK